jgi:uncharacterized protein YegL
MIQLLSPNQLVEGASVSWAETNDAAKYPAWITKVGENAYEATVNQWWVKKVAPHEQRLFDYCLRLHEVAHVRYGTFEYELKTDIHKLLFNMFEDVRVEFCLMAEFPGLVPYFRALAAFAKEVVYPMEAQTRLVADDLDVLLGHLRMGKNHPKHWLVKFVDPRIEVARRGEVDGTFLLATQVLALLLEHYDGAENIPIEIILLARGNRTGKQKQMIADAARIMDQSGDLRSVKDICEGVGLEGGPGSGIIDEAFVLNRDPRWDDIVTSHVQDITLVQQALRRIYNKLILVEAKRGDLNLAPHRMQQAYVDSFGDGEVTASYYRVMRRDEHKVDVLLLLDQSGSTGHIMHLISEAAILTAASAAGVKAVRLAVAGFGKRSGTTLIKEFASPPWAGNYAPVADGGTPLGQCMNDVANHRGYAWRRDAAHLVILLTDGHPDSWSHVQKAYELEYYETTVVVPMCVGGQSAGEYEHMFNRRPIEVVDVSAAAHAIFEVVAGEGSHWTEQR